MNQEIKGFKIDKVIVPVVVIGSRPTRDQNPHIPLIPEEIADSAYECFNEGANIVHVHVRVGFEDNLYLKKGQLAKSNAELVKRAVEIIRSLNKDMASVDETREILSIAN